MYSREGAHSSSVRVLPRAQLATVAVRALVYGIKVAEMEAKGAMLACMHILVWGDACFACCCRVIVLVTGKATREAAKEAAALEEIRREAAKADERVAAIRAKAKKNLKLSGNVGMFV